MGIVQTVKSLLGLGPKREVKAEDKLLGNNASDLVESYFEIVDYMEFRNLSDVDDGEGAKRIDQSIQWRTSSDVEYNLLIKPSSTDSGEYSVELTADGDTELSLDSVSPEDAVGEIEDAFEDLS